MKKLMNLTKKLKNLMKKLKNLMKKAKKNLEKDLEKKVKKVTEKNKKKSADSKQIIKRVLIEIVQFLSFYWKEPSKNTLISTILDPRYKDLNFLSVKSKLETETYLQELYDDLNFQLNSDSYLSETSITKQPSNKDSIFGALFGSDKRHKKKQMKWKAISMKVLQKKQNLILILMSGGMIIKKYFL